MDPMRRASAFGLALGYSLSWVLVCLSACMAQPSPAEHACCAQEAGVSATKRDCCSTAPTVTPHVPLVADMPQAAAADFVPQLIAPRTLLAPVTAVRAAASPPLVLRV
jgi:hypothetical protein